MPLFQSILDKLFIIKIKILDHSLNTLKIRQLKKYCIFDNTVKFYEESSVVNNLGDPLAIEIDSNTHIRGMLIIFGHGGRIKIGQYCYLGDNSRIWSAKSIEIGDRVLIAHDVNIFDNQTHPINHRSRHLQFVEIITSGFPKKIDLNEQSVKINNDAWIGANSIILKGVTIGEGAIVGAGSVVTKDVPPFTIVAGNPARIVRKIPEDEQ